MEPYRIIIILALGILVFGLYNLFRSIGVSRAAGGAWYSSQSRELQHKAHEYSLQAIALVVAGMLILLWVGLKVPQAALSNTQSPSPQPVMSHTPTLPTTTPTASITLTPTLEPTRRFSVTLPAGVSEDQVVIPVPTFVIGTNAIVANTGGGGLWLRDAPFGNNMVLLPEGATVYVQGTLVEIDGYMWQNVADAEGREGWVAADYLLYR